MTSTNFIIYDVLLVHIGIFACPEYSARKGATVQSSDVNDIGRMFFQTNVYLRGYPYLLSAHPNTFSPVSLKSSQ